MSLRRDVPAAVILLTGLLLVLAPLSSAQEGGELPDESAALSTSAEVERLVEEASQEAASDIATEDAVLRERLRSLLGAIDAFRTIRVDVEGGVVVLAGRASSRETATQAAALTEKLEGVLFVVDEVEIETGLEVRFAEAWDAVWSRLRSALAYLPLLAIALLIIAAAWILARLLRDADTLYRFASNRQLLQSLLRQTVFSAVLVAGVVAALQFLDAGAVIGTILGAAGVVGIALGFAFRNIVENYLAGVLLAVRQPFSARDVVSIDGSTGTVLRMTASETTLMDADGNHLRLPNAMVFNGRVLNYTRNPLRRFTVKVGVGTEVDLDRAQDLGVETLERMNGVVDDPVPSARVAVLGDSSVGLELYGWVHQEQASYAKVASEAHRLIKACYDENGIDMPAPMYEIHLEGPLPDSPAKPARRESPVPDAGPPPESIDVSPGDDISEQVEEELARSDEENLLE